MYLFFWVFLCSFSLSQLKINTVGTWLGLLTCKNRLPYYLYCVKPCSINQSRPDSVDAEWHDWM